MRKNAAHAAPERRVALLRLRYPIGEFVPEKFEVLRPELRVHTVGADEDIAAHVAVRHIVNALLLEESGIEAEYVCHIVLHESQAVEKPLLADALMGIFTEPRGVILPHALYYLPAPFLYFFGFYHDNAVGCLV